ncbi:hypothetical protein DRN87_06255 [Candidatus Geothermarchaeota archaeon]|nr:MAG: hypothetical protein DRN87_06255 [Candidatus Geothermarchaeota archaeon]
MDVVILTKDSMPTIKSTIESLLSSDIPINKIIFVDGYSKDGTLDYIGSLNKSLDIEVIMDCGNRATARQKGIESVSTDWFMFLDSDIILPRKWFKYAIKYMRDDVGAIWGTVINLSERAYYQYRLSKIFYKINLIELFRLRGLQRGYTHDTLINLNAVRGIRIPSFLDTFEDHYIRQYIERRGFKYIPAFPPYCIHIHEYKSLDNIQWFTNGFYGAMIKFYGMKDIFKQLLTGLVKLGIILASTGDLNSSLNQYKVHLYTSVGILKNILGERIFIK